MPFVDCGVAVSLEQFRIGPQYNPERDRLRITFEGGTELLLRQKWYPDGTYWLLDDVPPGIKAQGADWRVHWATSVETGRPLECRLYRSDGSPTDIIATTISNVVDIRPCQIGGSVAVTIQHIACP